MAFTIPQFPLTVNIWHDGPVFFPVGPPDLIVMGNLAWGRRVAVPSTGGTGSLGVPLFTMTLLVPKLTDIRGRLSTVAGADVVEVPAGSGRYYEVIYVDDLGKGFANEHRGALLLMRVCPTPLT